MSGMGHSGVARRRKSLQAISDLRDAGISTNFVLVAARGAGDADPTDHFVACLDRHASTDRNDVRDLLQISVFGLIS